MRANEFITEKKNRKGKKPKHAAYGPGPFGMYGVNTGYSSSDGGDGGGMEETLKSKRWRWSKPGWFSKLEAMIEASYPGNIGIMELTSFFKKASPRQILIFKKLVDANKKELAWKLVQDVLGIEDRLQGKEFEVTEGSKKDETL